MVDIFRDHLLAGKTAFLTGGGSGIGFAFAQRFAEHGAHVILCGRREPVLAEAKTAIESRGGAASIAALDVRDYAALDSALARAAAEHGAIDIVIAAAAGNFPAPAARMSANAFKSVIDIDVLGTFNTCRAAYAHLRRPGASVLAISAAHATTAIAYQSHVCAAKAAIELLIKTLAIEWGPEGIRCNTIVPGPTADTEGMRRLAPTPEDVRRAEDRVPLRRLGTKDELADLALFLCSDAAAYITGASFACDGGSGLTLYGSLVPNSGV